MESETFREALSLHRIAAGSIEAGRWPDAVDAARRSNLLLFQARDPGAARLAGANYAIAALGMLNQGEWHEAAILAELAVNERTPWEGEPGRAAAYLVLAKARFRRGECDAARAAIDALAALEPAAGPSSISEEAESLRARLGEA